MGRARRRREQERNVGGVDDPRFAAAVDLVGRTGAQDWTIRYSDEDGQPVVWIAVAGYPDGRSELAAGWTPLSAALRLCERLIDGGKCMHCQRPTGFTEDFEGEMSDRGMMFCWYRWDPELCTFRRGCESA